MTLHYVRGAPLLAAIAKLALVAILALGATVYLAYAGADRSWQYYILVDESVSSDELLGKRVRVRGEIAEGTLRITEDRRQTTFVVHGQTNGMPILKRCKKSHAVGFSRRAASDPRAN